MILFRCDMSQKRESPRFPEGFLECVLEVSNLRPPPCQGEFAAFRVVLASSVAHVCSRFAGLLTWCFPARAADAVAARFVGHSLGTAGGLA